MIYTLLGVFTAALFGIVAFNVYGYAGLSANPWINYAFWGLLATGFAMDFVRPYLGCLGCSPIQRAQFKADALTSK